ncbi:Aste57867_25426 [Aphanomyces stellatus]|uniref:Aste57867_25426 protein n=1 Tax=Aphanomyces stellatus TaxID=120398 RepID=A0A485LU32_9STRA|nr:hypothetical protein As57867_025347 [Aphanomyces stellatus]VFU02050.1 Aste57867_25426 [Aphanomyces stellatus]
MDRLENAMRLLEDMYGYVTNAEAQAHARASSLAELGRYILEAKKAADGTITLFQDTLLTLRQPSYTDERDVERRQDRRSPDRRDLHTPDDYPPPSPRTPPPPHKDASELPDVKVASPPKKKAPSPKQRKLTKSHFPKDGLMREKELRLLNDLHTEFHAKKAEFKMLRRRLGDAERVAKARIHDDTAVLKSFQRLQGEL